MNRAMTNHSLYRSSIFHCIETSGGVEPVYYEDGLMVIEGERIVEVGDYAELSVRYSSEGSIVRFKDSLIMPGFIDCHIHYPQYKVISSYGSSLLEWLNKYTFVEEQKFSDSDYAAKIAELFLDELIKNGTTTAMTFCASYKQSVDVFFSAAEKRNMRMIAGKVMMDRNAPAGLCDDIDSSYADSKSLIEKWHNKGRLGYAVTPRFAPTSTEGQLTQAAKLLTEHPDVLLQTHLNENSEEIAWVKKLYPKSRNYFDVYDKLGLSGPSSVFGHCIYNTADEYKRMAETSSKAALCPTSNLFLGSGLFALNELESYGIDVALASDVGGGDSFSMFDVMSQAYKVCRLNGYNLDPVKAFYLTTLAAAKVLGVDDSIGNFESNKEADFIVLDLNASELIKQKIQTVTDISDLLFCLMMLGDDRLVGEVYILGQCAYKK